VNKSATCSHTASGSVRWAAAGQACRRRSLAWPATGRGAQQGYAPHLVAAAAGQGPPGCGAGACQGVIHCFGVAQPCELLPTGGGTLGGVNGAVYTCSAVSLSAVSHCLSLPGSPACGGPPVAKSASRQTTETTLNMRGAAARHVTRPMMACVWQAKQRCYQLTTFGATPCESAVPLVTVELRAAEQRGYQHVHLSEACNTSHVHAR
jgi:hypothetical protein